MTERAPLLIHVGYHKTATTWLQRILFQPSFGYRQVMTHEEVFEKLVRPHELLFDPEPARALIEERRCIDGGGAVDVISCEILVGNPFFGSRESDVYARRLKAVAPDAKILFTIREQLRAITSVYMQYLTRGGTQTPKAFFADDPVMGYFAFAPETFEYHRLIEFYADLFGGDNIYVATQESLAEDAVGFVRNLGAFAGVVAGRDKEPLPRERTSPSPPEFCAPVLRRINHFRSGPTGWAPILDLGAIAERVYRGTAAVGRLPPVRGLFGEARPVSAHVAERFGGRYKESNRVLKEMFGGRLGLAGYES